MNTRTLIIFVLLIILIPGLIYFLTRTGTNQLGLTPSPTSNVSFPVPFDHRAVSSAKLSYEFRGIVKEIQNMENPAGDTQIILDSSDITTPAFVVSNETDIFLIRQGTSTPGTKEDIKVGSDIKILMSYEFTDLTWHLDIITIDLDGEM